MILFFLLSLIFSDYAKSNYWLKIEIYWQGLGGRPEVSGITNLSLSVIPMNELDTRNNGREKITNEIYKSVWLLDIRSACGHRGVW